MTPTPSQERANTAEVAEVVTPAIERGARALSYQAHMRDRIVPPTWQDEARECLSEALDVEEMAAAIWEASRADEGTISATGAKIVAKALRARLLGAAAASLLRQDPPQDVRSAVSTWLTLALDISRPSNALDMDMLALRDWIDGGCVGEMPTPQEQAQGTDDGVPLLAQAWAAEARKEREAHTAALARAEAAEARIREAEKMAEDIQRLRLERDELLQEREDYWADLGSEHYRVAKERDALRAVVEAVRGLDFDLLDWAIDEMGHTVYEATETEPAECTDECPACAVSEFATSLRAALSAQPVAQEGEDPLRVEVRRLLTEFDDYDKRREITLGYIESRLRPLVPVETGGEGRES